MRPEGGRDGALNWQNSSFQGVPEPTFHVRTSNSYKLIRVSLVQRCRARVQEYNNNHTLLGVLKVPAALDVLAAVVRIFGAARAEDLLAGLVVRLAAFFVR